MGPLKIYFGGVMVLYITGSRENIRDHAHQGAGQEPCEVKSACVGFVGEQSVNSGRATATRVDKVLDCLYCSLFC